MTEVEGGYEKSHRASTVSPAAGGGAWQDGAGGQDTDGSSGLVRGAAGYMRLRKESLVCLFTCHKQHQEVSVSAY